MAGFGVFMAMQFEPYGEGYVYRANGVGPALPATHAEFDRFVRFGGRNFLLNLAGVFVAVIVAAVATARWFPQGDEFGGFVMMGAAMLVIGYAFYRSVRWGMLAPQRALAGRTPVAPARTRKEAKAALRAWGAEQDRPPP